ncbi:MAG: hypothetical protein AABX02_00645, partial [archaeon]
GGSVAALDVSKVAVVNTDKVLIDKDNVKVVAANTARINVGEIRKIVLDRDQAREDLRARLSDDIRTVAKERLDRFRDAIKDMRRFIVDYRQATDRSNAFAGWNVQRIISQSELTSEQKVDLLEVYTVSKANAADWSKSSFTMFGVNDRYAMTGSFFGVQTDAGTAGTAKGFDSLNGKPFFMIWGNGDAVFLQDGKVGTIHYDSGYNATVSYDGEVYQTKYMMY